MDGMLQGQKRPLPNLLPNGDAHGYVDYSGLNDNICGICGNLHAPGQCELIRLPSMMAAVRQAILSPDNREPPGYKVCIALIAVAALG